MREPKEAKLDKLKAEPSVTQTLAAALVLAQSAGSMISIVMPDGSTLAA